MSDDYPFDEVVKVADKIIARGWTLYQKFTCAGCGERCTMEEPNSFYTSGNCECGHVTDIRERGCNYMAIGSSSLLGGLL
jgi:hypothetical protein